MELTDTSLWSVKTGIGDKFFVYLHDKGSGFVKYFGDTLSVYGRVVNGNDNRATPTTVIHSIQKVITGLRDKKPVCQTLKLLLPSELRALTFRLAGTSVTYP